MSELRLAARDFHSEKNPQSAHVRQPASAMAKLLEEARPELAFDQKDMIDGVIARLSNYRAGFEQIATLTERRLALMASLPALAERFNAAVAAVIVRDASTDADREAASPLPTLPNRIAQ